MCTATAALERHNVTSYSNWLDAPAPRTATPWPARSHDSARSKAFLLAIRLELPGPLRTPLKKRAASRGIFQVTTMKRFWRWPLWTKVNFRHGKSTRFAGIPQPRRTGRPGPKKSTGHRGCRRRPIKARQVHRRAPRAGRMPGENRGKKRTTSSRLASASHGDFQTLGSRLGIGGYICAAVDQQAAIFAALVKRHIHNFKGHVLRAIVARHGRDLQMAQA